MSMLVVMIVVMIVRVPMLVLMRMRISMLVRMMLVRMVMVMLVGRMRVIAMLMMMIAVLMLVMMMLVRMLMMVMIMFMRVMMMLLFIVVRMMMRRIDRRAIGSEDIELRCVNLAADDRASAERKHSLIESELRQPLLHHAERHSCVEERSNGHVAANPRKAIEVRDLHTSGLR
jgi:hypothetical protein